MSPTRQRATLAIRVVRLPWDGNTAETMDPDGYQYSVSNRNQWQALEVRACPVVDRQIERSDVERGGGVAPRPAIVSVRFGV